ncbi:MAG: hypothetical protein IKR26_04480 [Lachnospiraceae bacterium]|nr:hypothetical protein [Lachnospiraceae bacterium]
MQKDICIDKYCISYDSDERIKALKVALRVMHDKLKEGDIARESYERGFQDCYTAYYSPDGYDAPAELIARATESETVGSIWRAVQQYDIKVDRDELMKALRYDRCQYEKGYADGLSEGRRRAEMRCKE